MAVLIPPKKRPLLRARMVTALLVAALPAAALVTAALLAPVAAQAAKHSAIAGILAELRHVRDLRALSRGEDPGATEKSARTYLANFSQGRYRDEVLALLGSALALQDRTDDALGAYGQLIGQYADSPFREQALSESVRLHTRAGRHEEAAAARRSLFEHYPKSLYRDQILFREGQARFEDEDFKGALDSFSKIHPPALARSQQTALFHGSILARDRLGQREASRDLLTRYLNQGDAPTRKAALLIALGAQARASGRSEEAVQHYDTVLREFPGTPQEDEAAFRQASLMIPSPDPESGGDETASRRRMAIAAFDGYLARADAARAAEALRHRAMLLEAEGRLEQALSDYERLDSIQPRNQQPPEALRARAVLLRKLGREEQAVAVLAAGASNKAYPAGERAAFSLELADGDYRAGRCKEVIGRLTPMPLFSEQAGSNHAAFLRGVCQFRMGQHARAALDLEGLLNEKRYLPLVWPTLLDVHEAAGRHERVVNLGRELMVSKGVPPNPELLGRLQRSYRALGEPGLGLALFRRLARQQPGNMGTPPLQLFLARVELKDGDAARARKLLEGVVDSPGAGEGTPLSYRFQALGNLQGIFLKAGEHETLLGMDTRAIAWADSPGEQRLLREWLGVLHFAWGKAALAKRGAGAEAALVRLEIALAFLPQEQARTRAEAVELLVRTLQKHRGANASAQRYQAEMMSAEHPAYRKALTARLQKLALEWAEPGKHKGGRKGAIARLRKVLGAFPREQWADRYRIAVSLDALYQADGAYGQRVKLYKSIEKDIADPALQNQVRLFRSQLYREWGDTAAARKQYGRALKRYRASMRLLKAPNTRQRFDLVVATGRAHRARKEPTELALLYEVNIPLVGNRELTARLRQQAGQHYLDWGRQAEKAKNDKSARIRYWYALDILPQTDWQRRLTATVALAGVLEREQRLAEGSALLAGLMPQVPDADLRQRYSLYLGRIYREKLKDKPSAAAWLTQAERGAADPISLEAGYLLAEMEIESGSAPAALKRLNGLAQRGLEGSKWRVPIHYRIAVLYHEQKSLEPALKHYRIVAATKAPNMKSLYPRSIGQARRQAAAIAAYLRMQGRGSGSSISVPKVRRHR